MVSLRNTRQHPQGSGLADKSILRARVADGKRARLQDQPTPTSGDSPALVQDGQASGLSSSVSSTARTRQIRPGLEGPQLA